MARLGGIQKVATTSENFLRVGTSEGISMAGACEAVDVFVAGMCVAPSSSSSPKGEGFGVTPPGFLPELPSENALTPNDLVGCTIEKIARATMQGAENAPWS